MKKQIAILCALLIAALIPAAAQASFHWRVDTTGKYLNDDSVRQILAVQGIENTTKAHVILFDKSESNGKTVWTEVLSCDGVIGKNGLGKTKEGDNKTPVGDFGVLTAFGIKENPGTTLPYLDVDENTYCCGDSNYYNRLIDITECPHDCADGEHLIEYSPEYNYGMFLDYNKEGTVGLGSAIFFHCAGANYYTGGCIAVSEENMIRILQTAQPGIRVIINSVPE